MIDVAVQLYESYFETFDGLFIVTKLESDEEAVIVQGALDGVQDCQLKLSKLHKDCGNSKGYDYWSKIADDTESPLALDSNPIEREKETSQVQPDDIDALPLENEKEMSQARSFQGLQFLGQNVLYSLGIAGIVLAGAMYLLGALAVLTSIITTIGILYAINN